MNPKLLPWIFGFDTNSCPYCLLKCQISLHAGQSVGRKEGEWRWRERERKRERERERERESGGDRRLDDTPIDMSHMFSSGWKIMCDKHQRREITLLLMRKKGETFICPNSMGESLGFCSLLLFTLPGKRWVPFFATPLLEGPLPTGAEYLVCGDNQQHTAVKMA